MSNFWRIHCHIGHHPGQWQFWFKQQCCAVGWPPPSSDGINGSDGSGWKFDGKGGDHDWVATRSALKKMRAKDWVVVTLPGLRVGRLGQVVEMAVSDDQWDPIIPKSKTRPLGDMGRRIIVRWDLSVGPDDPSKVVLLPPEARFNSGEARGTIRSIPVSKLPLIRKAMRDSANWVSLSGTFDIEKALSDYISVHPQRLESGMISHPFLQARELTFRNRKRADVILQDGNGNVVIAECKQNGPSFDDLRQVILYRDLLCKEYPELGNCVRTLLVHGGANLVLPKIAEEAKKLTVELVYFEVQVIFFGVRR